MRKRSAIGLCMACMIGLVFYFGISLKIEAEKVYAPVAYVTEIMGIAVVDDMSFLEGKRKVVLEENPGVYFEETLLPYSRYNKTLYLPQNYEEAEWVGELSAGDNAFLCMPYDEYWEDKTRAIFEGHEFTVWLVTEEVYYELMLVASGMPVISVSTGWMEEQEKVPYEEDPDKLIYDSENLYYGDIAVFNPGIGSEEYAITDCAVRYYYRGNLSAGYEKPSFSVSLLDEQGENLNESLLGMRADNSWKLISLVTDTNRIREKTASQIWECFAEANSSVKEDGPRMEYVELVLDNEYKGLYCLMEPVDDKKLELDENDNLYKIINWNVITDDAIQYSVDRDWKVQDSIRIRYPDVITDYEAAWYPVRNYLNTFYHGTESYDNVTELLYPENAYDLFMFLMTVSAADNHYKNMYYAADVDEAGNYKMRQIPWDLDYTFGNVHDGQVIQYSMFDPDETKVYKEMSIDVLLKHAPETVGPLLVDRWYTYREDFLSNISIEQLLMENMNYLMMSGVIERENQRWPQYSVSTDIAYLIEYQTRRMEWLDAYFGGLE